MFAVMAEMHDGEVVRLRGGFASRDAAEDHPVKMKYWKRVWVDDDPKPDQAPRPVHTPPFPWTPEWVGGHCYMRDAEGRRFASLLGTQERREKVAAMLYDYSNAKGDGELPPQERHLAGDQGRAG